MRCSLGARKENPVKQKGTLEALIYAILGTCTGNSLISTPLIPDGSRMQKSTRSLRIAYRPTAATGLCSLLAFCEEKIAHGADIFRGLVNVHDAGLCLTMAK